MEGQVGFGADGSCSFHLQTPFIPSSHVTHWISITTTSAIVIVKTDLHLIYIHWHHVDCRPARQMLIRNFWSSFFKEFKTSTLLILTWGQWIRFLHFVAERQLYFGTYRDTVQGKRPSKNDKQTQKTLKQSKLAAVLLYFSLDNWTRGSKLV